MTMLVNAPLTKEPVKYFARLTYYNYWITFRIDSGARSIFLVHQLLEVEHLFFWKFFVLLEKTVSRKDLIYFYSFNNCIYNIYRRALS
jgi:hypothetical protein